MGQQLKGVHCSLLGSGQEWAPCLGKSRGVRGLEKTKAQVPVAQDSGKETESRMRPRELRAEGCKASRPTLKLSLPRSASILAFPASGASGQFHFWQQLQQGWNCKNLSSHLEFILCGWNEQNGTFSGQGKTSGSRFKNCGFLRSLSGLTVGLLNSPSLLQQRYIKGIHFLLSVSSLSWQLKLLFRRQEICYLATM